MTKAKTSILFTTTLSIIFVFGIASFMSGNNKTNPSQNSSISTPLEKTFDSVIALSEYFQKTNYLWPINQSTKIPHIQINAVPADLKTAPIQEKKTLFLRLMIPIILAEKKHLREKRELIEQIFSREEAPITPESSPWFTSLLKEYRVSLKLDFEAQKQQLLKKVDELPTSFILAQAAIESGWGTSRFAIEGNSLFGEWTYGKNKGLVPNERQEGKSHQVKAFANISESVRSYIRNINRNRAYQELREIRAQMRQQNKKLDASKLAEGLIRYSEKGVDYVTTVQKLLNSPEFKLIESLDLQPESVASST